MAVDFGSTAPTAESSATVKKADAASPATVDSFMLPDLVSHCTFPLAYHDNGDAVASQSVRWLDQNCPMLNEKRRKALYGLQAGELTAFCYNNTTDERLRVVSDFMNYLFHLDNISDGMMTSDTDVLADSVMNALWFPAAYKATHASGKKQPEEEINAGKLAREYALDIDLPEEVASSPAISALNEYTNDLVTWSNDIFSYNVEQARGDTHNMIVILMVHYGHTLQSAMDFVGEKCRNCIDNFNATRENLPSWGPEVDDMVQRYVKGLQDWIVGSLHWSFQTTRYFGSEGQAVKNTRYVKLLPVREEAKW
ncbi:hypothetical protein AAF712_005844 [Marasmius tenuissimus]|uniref:Terpene synthase n=1 Tax=Marasmius tenuissimus TaxID=585030 RepID=A0ABR3A0F7_9AGAR